MQVNALLTHRIGMEALVEAGGHTQHAFYELLHLHMI